MWIKNSVFFGYFNGVWLYGYNIGIGGVGLIFDNFVMCGLYLVVVLVSSNLFNGMSLLFVNVWMGMWVFGMLLGMFGMVGVFVVLFGWNVC